MSFHTLPNRRSLTVSVEEIIEAINKLKSSQSCGTDAITSNMLKIIKLEIAPILHHLINMSINSKTFPECWKFATVTPLFKGGNAEVCDNYHPISVLPTLGKVLERLVYNQCVAYLNANSILSVSQAGFREGHSTGACLADFLSEIYEEIDNGGNGAVLFLDLAKAFDTVDHAILIDKLKLLGFKASTQTWFKSYLTNRCQSTKVGNTVSAVSNISCGVPQGSILGPLVFMLCK